MPATVEWANDEHTIVLITYSDPTTIAEIADAQDRTLALLDSAPYPIATVFDMRGIKDIPSNTITSFPRLGSHPSIDHANNGSITLVIDDYFVKQVADIFGRLFFHRHRVVRTLDEAYRLAATRAA